MPAASLALHAQNRLIYLLIGHPGQVSEVGSRCLAISTRPLLRVSTRASPRASHTINHDNLASTKHWFNAGQGCHLHQDIIYREFNNLIATSLVTFEPNSIHEATETQRGTGSEGGKKEGRSRSSISVVNKSMK
jgi:hypothetical protein